MYQKAYAAWLAEQDMQHCGGSDSHDLHGTSDIASDEEEEEVEHWGGARDTDRVEGMCLFK